MPFDSPDPIDWKMIVAQDARTPGASTAPPTSRRQAMRQSVAILPT
jgi:hypothetical protein